jgi:hypothetical protein
MSFIDFLRPRGAAVARETLVVEIPAPRQIPQLDKDVASSVATLQGHPGFQWLLQRLRIQRAQLQSALSSQRQATLTDVEFLQSGIAWTCWLEAQLAKAVGYQEPRVPQAPYDAERDAFDEVSKFIEVIR